MKRFRFSCLLFTVLLAGALYAQTSEFEQALAAVESYDFGQDRQSLTRVEQLILAATPQEHRLQERHLVDLLQRTTSPGLQDFLCRQLSLIGSEEAVPALVKLMSDGKTADRARYALERINGPLVDRQLRLLLPSVSDSIKIGIVTTLGVRADTEAVSLLAAELTSTNTQLAQAAASALGGIGTTAAAEVLAKAQTSTSEPVKLRILDAQLRCAEKQAQAGQTTAALASYTRLYDQSFPPRIRAAALRAQIQLDAEHAGQRIQKAMQASDDEIRLAAITSVEHVQDANELAAIAAALPTIKPSSQRVLLAALGALKRPEVLPAVTMQVSSGSPLVRMAALQAVGQLGDASSVEILAGKAATASGSERETARSALYGLRGAGVNDKMLSLLRSADNSVKIELIKALTERQVESASPDLLVLAGIPSRTLQREACKALAKVARLQDLPAIVQLVVRQPGRQYEDMLVAAALRFEDSKDRAVPVVEAFNTAQEGAVQAALLRVLGRIGDSQGLAVIRQALAQDSSRMRTEAIRALSLWPTPDPKEQLFTLAKEEQEITRHVLALRGFTTMATMPDTQTAAQSVQDLKRAWDITRRDDEKRLLLAALPRCACPEGLAFAQSVAGQGKLQLEAHSALIVIGDKLARKKPSQVKQALEQVVSQTDNPAIKKRAQNVLDKIK